MQSPTDQQLQQLLDLLSNCSMQATASTSTSSGSMPQDSSYVTGPGMAPSSGPSRNHRPTGRQAETQHRSTNYPHASSSEMVSEDHFAANSTGGVGRRTKPYHRRGRFRKARELKKRRLNSAIPTLAPAPVVMSAPVSIPVLLVSESTTPTTEITQWTVEEDDDDFDKMSIGSD